eukprot:CAMPEP_0198599730 /NCGR_PEP_ID=MMETSP1462-20131121/147304_1 /TAXON_ID=1333877 /ORGANISM="Brandtodinium nutriculum, Strain RCC3387" /LENGTH=115 /DNA_ID=CAMNT_0044331427 /DNA_START=39 /DNA_END=383 /DNA_ORIENTATION=-
MADAQDPNDSCLRRLSQAPGLERFQHVVLVSSHQDHYVPYESARIEMTSQAETDPHFGGVYVEMVNALLGRIGPERLLRLDLNFHMPETRLDTVMGRAAHVQVTECDMLVQMFVH